MARGTAKLASPFVAIGMAGDADVAEGRHCDRQQRRRSNDESDCAGAGLYRRSRNTQARTRLADRREWDGATRIRRSTTRAVWSEASTGTPALSLRIVLG
jgi:hypothetical protein